MPCLQYWFYFWTMLRSTLKPFVPIHIIFLSKATIWSHENLSHCLTLLFCFWSTPCFLPIFWFIKKFVASLYLFLILDLRFSYFFEKFLSMSHSHFHFLLLLFSLFFYSPCIPRAVPSLHSITSEKSGLVLPFRTISPHQRQWSFDYFGRSKNREKFKQCKQAESSFLISSLLGLLPFSQEECRSCSHSTGKSE